MRITTLLAASLAAVTLAVPAAASADTLVGETFTSGGHAESFGYSGVCNPDGPSTFEFGSFGPATGPHAGDFEEYGSVTLASPSGPVTDFDATFTLWSDDQINGTQALASSVTASCTPDGSNAFDVDLDATYSVTAPFTESGPSTVRIQGAYGNGTLVSSFSPRQSPPPPPQQGPKKKDDCKDGGWKAYGFANQGQCIRFVNSQP